MSKEKKGLGKGLKSIFGDDNIMTQPAEPVKTEEALPLGEAMVRLALIEPNGRQPRKNFDGDMLKELTESVRQHGVLEPLLVQKNGATYKIIAGERRWRAAQAAGLKEVPVVIRDYSPQQAMEISIIENVQRSDLNPVEEANAYRMLLEEYHLTQEEIAEKVSKNRTTVTNSLRLLKLSTKVQGMVIDGSLSSGHARALLSLENQELQDLVADRIVGDSLSVRETEKVVKELQKEPKKKEKQTENNDYTLFFRDYENKMKEILGAKVRINSKNRHKGKIEIDYFSNAELERLMDLFKTIRND